MEVSIGYLEVPHNNRVWRKWNLQTQTENNSLFCGWFLHSWSCFTTRISCIEADSILGSVAGLVVFRRKQRDIVPWLRLQLRMEKQSMQLSPVTDMDLLFFSWCLSVFIMPHFEVESRIREVAWFNTATPTSQHLYESAFIYEDEKWNVPVPSFAGIRDFTSKKRSERGGGDSKNKIAPHVLYASSLWIVARQSSHATGCQTLKYIWDWNEVWGSPSICLPFWSRK